MNIGNKKSIYNNGKAVSELSREYKISKISVSNWVKYAKNR